MKKTHFRPKTQHPNLTKNFYLETPVKVLQNPANCVYLYRRPLREELHMLAVICTMSENPGDRAFMLELYHQFFRLMFFTARKCHLEQDACEEVVQESLVKLIQKVGLLRELPRPVLASYIVSTTRNAAFDYTKRQKRQDECVVSLDDESVTDALEASFPPLDDQMEAEELGERLAAVLDELSNDDRILLEGKYILQYSDATLAMLLNCKTNSVRAKLTRARRRALKLFKTRGGGDQ